MNKIEKEKIGKKDGTLEVYNQKLFCIIWLYMIAVFMRNVFFFNCTKMLPVFGIWWNFLRVSVLCLIFTYKKYSSQKTQPLVNRRKLHPSNSWLTNYQRKHYKKASYCVTEFTGKSFSFWLNHLIFDRLQRSTARKY